MPITVTFAGGVPWYQNWQLWTAIGTILVAFSAFTLGNLIKYQFDMNMELKKKERAGKDLALALRSELISINTQFRIATQSWRISFANDVMRERLKVRDDDNNVQNENYDDETVKDINKGNDNFYDKIPMELSLDIYKNNISQIGLLPPDLSENVIVKFNALKALYDFQIYRKMTVTSRSIDFFDEYIVGQYNSVVNLSMSLIQELSKYAGVLSPKVETEHPFELYKGMASSVEKLRSRLSRTDPPVE
jgi:hypothetical protein